MSAGSDEAVIFGLLERGEVEGLKRFTPVGFDWSTCGGVYDVPALHHAILEGVASSGLATDQTPLINAIKWLLHSGADPRQIRVPLSSRRSYTDFTYLVCSPEELSEISVPLAGHSAVSLVLELHKAHKFSVPAFSSTARCAFLDAVLSAFTTPPSKPQEKVTVESCLLDRWESVLEMKETHNVTFDTADGEVTAHDLLLMAVSPVLKAMLESSMKEGRSRRISVKDASSSGVSLFVEMLYTNATRTDPDYKTMLDAIDVAHRWQVNSVACTLADALCEHVTNESFIPIAEAAALKELDTLAKACAVFATKSEQIQAMLRNGRIPPCVGRLLGQPESTDSGRASRKKRRIF
eukprot:s2318_g6.t1